MESGRRAIRAARSLGQAAALVALLGFARQASAFCRTTSVPVAIGYDPAAEGACWTSGDAGSFVDLAWPARSRIPYSLVSSASVQVTLADATAAAHLAFGAWGGPTGPDAGPMCSGGQPNVQTYDNGPVAPSVAATDCGLNPCADTVHDPLHLIVFRDTSWSGTDAVNTLALTVVTYGVHSGAIYDADTEINTYQHMVTTEEPPPPAGYPTNTYDLQSILTHEAGHFLGLAHSTDTSAVMYAYYHPGSVNLTADDVAGVCSIYPPLPPTGGSCAFVPARPSGPAPVVGFLIAILGWRRARRALSGAAPSGPARRR
jgi:hypothetical protein